MPAIFRALLGNAGALRGRHRNEGPDTFSAFDNLGHLIHGERTDWIPRARTFSRRARIGGSSWPTASRTTRAGIRAWRSSLTSSRASAPRT